MFAINEILMHIQGKAANIAAGNGLRYKIGHVHICGGASEKNFVRLPLLQKIECTGVKLSRYLYFNFVRSKMMITLNPSTGHCYRRVVY